MNWNGCRFVAHVDETVRSGVAILFQDGTRHFNFLYTDIFRDLYRCFMPVDNPTDLIRHFQSKTHDFGRRDSFSIDAKQSKLQDLTQYFWPAQLNKFTLYHSQDRFSAPLLFR
jgi:hypothetical protein